MVEIPVAAAVITRPDGRFLLAQRPAGKPYSGWWEFPGGKIEPGETVDEALRRELFEELGIEVETAYPWITRRYRYTHAAVRLHFRRVTRWRHEPHGKEDQALAWATADAPGVAPILPANGPILKALALPPVYGISQAGELGDAEFLRRLDVALARGLRLVQIREKGMPEARLRPLAQAIVARARQHGARVLVNGDGWLAGRIGADGVHLPAASLARLGERPPLPLCGASCHDERELAQAAALDLDFVVLGPVQRTRSHPDARPLGWERFAALAQDYPLPVYALGGMTPADLETAWRCGAHGIAMVRGAWPPSAA